MFKKILCVLSLMLALPVVAGEFDNAVKNNDKIFLYLYSPSCGYCAKFSPIYGKLSKNYGTKCKFVKFDTTTKEGLELSRRFNTMFVPYGIAINNKTHTGVQISPDCLIDYACVNSVMSKFVN